MIRYMIEEWITWGTASDSSTSSSIVLLSAKLLRWESPMMQKLRFDEKGEVSDHAKWEKNREILIKLRFELWKSENSARFTWENYINCYCIAFFEYRPHSNVTSWSQGHATFMFLYFLNSVTIVLFIICLPRGFPSMPIKKRLLAHWEIPF